MNILQIISGAVIGTSLMTLFSYAMSRLRKKQFGEPALLNELLVRARLIKFISSRNHPAGWAIHYGVGLLFVIGYHVIAYLTDIEVTFGYFVLAGTISGLLGIGTWHLVFRGHPNPPTIDLKEFYLQLEAAHIIFGAGAYAGILIF